MDLSGELERGNDFEYIKAFYSTYIFNFNNDCWMGSC